MFSKPGTSACGSNDPIESYDSIKPSNDDMKIDSEGVNLHNSKPKQVEQVQSISGGKPFKEVIAAIVSPQKPRHDI